MLGFVGFENEETDWILCEGLVSRMDHHRGEWTMRAQPSSVSQHSWIIIWQQCFKWWKKVQLEELGHRVHVMGNRYSVPILLFQVCYPPCHVVHPCSGLTDMETASHGLDCWLGAHIHLSSFKWFLLGTMCEDAEGSNQ